MTIKGDSADHHSVAGELAACVSVGWLSVSECRLCGAAADG